MFELLPANFRRGCVITLGDLSNAQVDQIFQIGGLKDLQKLFKCRADPTGTGLLGLGIPPTKSEEGSPHSEDWLFSKAGLSEDDLNNKNMVSSSISSSRSWSSVKWPRHS